MCRLLAQDLVAAVLNLGKTQRIRAKVWLSQTIYTTFSQSTSLNVMAVGGTLLGPACMFKPASVTLFVALFAM
eukprot:scaffold496020_cov36-Prasinocladus_malaysianus.AAC.1